MTIGWKAPPAISATRSIWPASTRSTGRPVAVRCLPRSERARWWSIFAGTVPLAGLLVWAVSATLVSVATVWCAELYLRRRRAGLEVGRWRIGPFSSGVCGLVWASLPFFVFPSENHYDLRAIYLIFLCGISAANAVGTAARRSYFLAFQFALFVPIDVVCLWHRTSPPRCSVWSCPSICS